MRIYLSAITLAVLGTASFANAHIFQKAGQQAGEINEATASEPEHWQTPSDASAPDRANMREWYRLNELCRGSSDAATIEVMCPKRDRVYAALEQLGWCWVYEDSAVFSANYRWHRCSQKARPPVQSAQLRLTSPIRQGSVGLMKSATKARDIGGFELGMSIRDAARLAPLEKISDDDYRATKDGVAFEFGVSRLGHIFCVDSTQKLGKFVPDNVFRQSLIAKLSAKYGPPQATSVETFRWSLIEPVKGVGERILPFETNWASAYLDNEADNVTLHIKLLDFRIRWKDDAQRNQAPRDRAVGEVAL